MKAQALLDAMATHALHGAARLALQIQSPLAAKRTVMRLAARLRPFTDVDEARAAARVLSRKGTCLSRSLAIAARLPGSNVVIGVDVRRSSRVLGHAWVQLGSEIVYPAQPNGETIACF